MGSQNKIALDMRTFLLIAAVAFLALGQDDGSTYHCPDGWHYAEIGSVTECILLGDRTEKVTKADAAVLCQFHGGWLVDLADSRGPAKNNLLKSLISDADDHECCDWPGPQYNDQWWIGATCNGPHSSPSSSWPTRWVTGFTTGTTGTARPWRGTFARNLQTHSSLVIYIAKYILILH